MIERRAALCEDSSGCFGSARQRLAFDVSLGGLVQMPVPDIFECSIEADAFETVIEANRPTFGSGPRR